MATVWSQIKGKEDVVLFKRRIVIETILKALTVAMSGLMIVDNHYPVFKRYRKGTQFHYVFI